MKHRLFNLAVVISLLLCLACVGMWVRSGWVQDTLSKQLTGGTGVTITSGVGNTAIEVEKPLEEDLVESLGSPGSSGAVPQLMPTSAGPWEWTTLVEQEVTGDSSPSWMFAWPECDSHVIRINGPGNMPTFYTVILPYWFLMLLTAILPALWFWQRRKEKHRRGFEVLPAPAAKTEP